MFRYEKIGYTSRHAQKELALFKSITHETFCVTPTGVKHLDDCPVQPKVPIYLLVGGCFGLLKLLSLVWQQVRYRRNRMMDDIGSRNDDDDDGNNVHATSTNNNNNDNDDDYDDDDDYNSVMVSRSSRFTEVVLSGFLVVWFVAGNYWVLSVWPPNYVHALHEPSNWCDKTVYLVAVVQIISSYAVVGATLLGASLGALCRWTVT